MMFVFDKNLAVRYGLDESIILQNLIFWIDKNRANGRHFYDGYFWTYNSSRAFVDIFPFWTQKQIERIIRSLKAQGAIKTGNFNQSSYDRTMWYAVDESVRSISSKREMELPKKENEFTDLGEPIPDIKQDNKTDDKQNIRISRADSGTAKHAAPCNTVSGREFNRKKNKLTKPKPEMPEDVEEIVWQDFLAVRSAKKAAVTSTAIDGIRREAAKAGYTLNEALIECTTRGWAGFKAAWVNQSNHVAINQQAKPQKFNAMTHYAEQQRQWREEQSGK